MKHATRWDLPKGHVDPGETDRQCALRELEEETGIKADALRIDENFVFEHHYEVSYKRDGGKFHPKTLIIFLAWLEQEAEIQVTEHQGFRWFPWQDPPSPLQAMTIDPLLQSVAEFLRRPAAS